VWQQNWLLVRSGVAVKKKAAHSEDSCLLEVVWHQNWLLIQSM